MNRHVVESKVIQGYKLDFSVKPYDVQLQYMDALLGGIAQGHNCLLESPTGTGKSISFLSSLVGKLASPKSSGARSSFFLLMPSYRPSYQAYINGSKGGASVPQVATTPPADPRSPIFLKRSPQAKRARTIKYEREAEQVGTPDEPPGGAAPAKVFVLTRTHGQLEQLVRTLRGLPGAQHISSTTLASRRVYCRHPKVMHSSDVNAECKKQRKKAPRGCEWKNSQILLTNPINAPISDIEDLINTSKERKGGCPYYFSIDLMQAADIVFCNYLHLMTPGMRRHFNVSLSNSIVLFDEGHNIEGVAMHTTSKEDSSSNKLAHLTIMLYTFQKFKQPLLFSASQFSLALLRIERPTHDSCSTSGRDHIDCRVLIEFFEKLKREVESLAEKAVLPRDPESEVPVVVQGADLRRLLFQVMRLDSAFPRLARLAGRISGCDFEMEPEAAQEMAGWLQAFEFLVSERDSVDCYALSISPLDPEAHVELLSLYCLSPHVALAVFGRQCRSVVVTSGSMAPFSSFEAETRLSFPVKLELEHVVPDSRLFLGRVCRRRWTHWDYCKLPGDSQEAAQQHQAVEAQFLDFGNFLVNDVCRCTPRGGVLVFFPNFRLLKSMTQFFESNEIGEQLVSLKKGGWFSEKKGQNTTEFNDCITHFQDAITDKDSGAIFFCVCRGRASEGIDFANDAGRAVVVVGIPYVAKVGRHKLKYEYNESDAQPELSHDDWYQQMAFRAVNQAVGRVIRHQYDYGTIFFDDMRYKSKQHFLCRWIQQRLNEGKLLDPQQLPWNSRVLCCSQCRRPVVERKDDRIPVVDGGQCLLFADVETVMFKDDFEVNALVQEQDGMLRCVCGNIVGTKLDDGRISWFQPCLL